MSNMDLRNYAKTHGVRLWQVADVLGIPDFQLSRKLRHEFAEEDKVRFVHIVDSISTGKE